MLDLTNALDGEFTVIDRVPVGLEKKARLEAVGSSEGGRFIFVSISNGGGDEATIARIETLETP